MMRTIPVFVALVCAACGGKMTAPAPMQPDGVLDVTLPPYNAKGDGTSDDTAAFQHALDDAGRAGGGIVFAPSHRYRIAGHLSIPTSTVLKGIFVAPTEVDLNQRTPTTTGPGSMLLAEEGAGSDGGTPFISLNGHNATIDGFIIFYPHQTPTNPPIKYPYTIAAGVDPGPDGPRAQDIAIQNVTLANSYDGIDLGTHESSRHYVNNVYGQPAHIGIFVDQCFDVGRIENVHFNGNWSAAQGWGDFTYQQGISFLFYRSDAEYMSNIYSWGFHVGMQFQHSPGHDDWSTYALITNLGLENSDIGINAIDTAGSGITIDNFDWASPSDIGMYRYVIWEPAGGAKFGAHVSLHNAAIANGYHHIARLEQNTGSVMLVGNSFGPTIDTAAPELEILGGQAIVTSNDFMLGNAQYPLAHVAQTAGQVVITDNIIGLGQIVVDPGANQVTVANNQAVP